MKTTRYLTLFIIAFFLASCKGIPYEDLISSSEDETVDVANYKVECYLYGATDPSLCLQIRVDDGDWYLIEDDEINNFTYSWGYDYELEVEVEEQTSAADDEPQYEYTLIEQIDKDEASSNDEFEFSISGNPISDYIEKVSGEDNTYEIFGDKEFECDDDDCDEIDTLINNNQAMLLEFEHQSDPSDPLELKSINCTDNLTDFDTNCF